MEEMQRNILVVLAATAALSTGVAACRSTSLQQTTPPAPAAASSHALTSTHPPARAAATAAQQTAGRAAALSVLAEPGAGTGRIYQLITGARTSVDLTMY
jgi:hypothetical protein